jgi:uncharacterized damage-inducible protein DinB
VRIADMLLSEFDHETAVTRLLLERAPESRLLWAPHQKSWTMGNLCLHLATLPSWAALVLQHVSFDMNPPEGPRPKRQFESQPETLRLFDRHVAEARQAIAGASDAEFLARWTLRDAERTVFTLPRISALRSFVLSHMIHHRGQLSIYFRLCDVPLPPMYGPTADSAGPDV